MPILNVFVRPLGAARCLALILSVLPVAGGAQDNLIRPAVSANSEIESRRRAWSKCSKTAWMTR